MPQARPLEWTTENVAAFWDFESSFPHRHFSYANAVGMAKRLGKHLANSDSILDYGCAIGIFLARLAEQGYRVAGTDLSEQSLKITRDRLQKYDNFLGAFTADALVAEGRRFDTILATELVEHLYDDWLDDVLDKFRRLLKPNGRIIVSTPNCERLEDNLLMCPCCRSVFHRWQHVRTWSESTLTDYLEQRGFRILDTFTTDFSVVETAQEKWEKLSRWKKFKKTIKGRTPKAEPPPSERPHLVVVFQPAA